MKADLVKLIQHALDDLSTQGVFSAEGMREPMVERTRDPAHGDFATNVALIHSKAAKIPPRELAEKILAALPNAPWLAHAEVAGPGFINFRLSADAHLTVVASILDQGEQFGRSNPAQRQKAHIEFVSANPTGPLHIGHGRGAAYGSAIANLLEAIGYDVYREYYVNDAGRQMNILATSIWLRYLELVGETIKFPTNAYKGDYIWDIAATLHREHGEDYRHPADQVHANLPADEPDGGNKEQHIDAFIERAQQLLGDSAYQTIFQLGRHVILEDIRDDLARFRVNYENWYSEQGLFDSDTVTQTIERLRQENLLYLKEGNWWFRSTDYGDEKDRVVVRENGSPTYFASDIAYHLDKIERGFDRMINVWGADHHGYAPRVKAALKALNHDPKCLDVLLVQFAVLYENGEKKSMSTRSGEFITLRELRKDVGADAARFFYVMRKSEQHMDFDLDLARSQSNDNPVYYVQYAHARICAVLRQAKEKGYPTRITPGIQNLTRLTESHESNLLKTLARYPETLHNAATQAEPHQLVHYLRELANELHTYYNAHQFLVTDEALRDARLKLILATRQVIKNGLALIGVEAPEKM